MLSDLIRQLLTGTLISSAIISYGQHPAPDTVFLTKARTQMIARYEDDMKPQSRLYNGTEYQDYFSKNDEHPYFGIDDWSYGDILYDDELYENVAIFYDISRDRVITEHGLNGAKIELITEKVSTFTINNHKFVHLKSPDQTIDVGFYEVLSDGKTKVYARRQKFLQQTAESNDIIYTFEEKNRLYIFKDGIFHSVRSKKSVLKVLKDRKQALTAYLNKNNMRFKTNREDAISKMASQYDAESN
ncbi:MAG: hypothetical protein WKF87_16960 [Chryseolinea sp.]